MKIVDWLIETWNLPISVITVGTRDKGNNHILEFIMENSIKPTSISSTMCVATFGNTKIWIGNYPYSYGGVYTGYGTGRDLPTLRVAYRFHKYMSKLLHQKMIDSLT